MENSKQLAVALVAIQAEIMGAKKTKENPHLKSKYADLGAVWEACRDALTKHGVAVIQRPTFHDGLAFCATTLLHVSGESISGEYLIRPVKEDPQAYGSAFTYARRYSLMGMLGVVGEDDDGHRGSQRSAAPANTDKIRDKLAGGEFITKAEGVILFKAWRASGISDADAAAYLQDNYGVSSTDKIKRADLAPLMSWATKRR